MPAWIVVVKRASENKTSIDKNDCKDEDKNEEGACKSESEERISHCCKALSDSPSRREVDSACKKYVVTLIVAW